MTQRWRQCFWKVRVSIEQNQGFLTLPVDAFTQLAIEEDVPQFAIEEDAPQELPLFFEADDYETTPEPCSGGLTPKALF